MVGGGTATGLPWSFRARLIPAIRPVPSDSVYPSTPVSWPARLVEVNGPANPALDVRDVDTAASCGDDDRAQVKQRDRRAAADPEDALLDRGLAIIAECFDELA